MSNDDRIVELLTQSLQTQDRMLARLDGMDAHFESMDAHFESMEVRFASMDMRLERLENMQYKTNVLLQEHSLSIVKLADKLDSVLDMSHRVSRLEDAVFHA